MIDRHLTDEEFSELLGGSAGADPQAHVQACARCHAELETLRHSLGSFHELGMLWAEAEAPRRIRVPLHRWQRWPLQSFSLVSATLIVACLVLFGVRGRHFEAGPAPHPASAAAPVSEQTSLAEDNQLMVSIDRELSANVELPVPVQDLRLSAGVRHRHSAASMEN
jgi:hypothetical protein